MCLPYRAFYRWKAIFERRKRLRYLQINRLEPDTWNFRLGITVSFFFEVFDINRTTNAMSSLRR
jgi:hypothetical protein